ncbi:MAG TPA: outer membrane protein assembly factor BamD [Kiritimatiellae bacterium]|nr:outer membrane protein assembly factor BamD [Kiritimatiellia bacterium]
MKNQTLAAVSGPGIAVLLLVVGCATGGTRAITPPPDCARWQALIDRADQAARQGRWNRAAALYRKYLKRCTDGSHSIAARLDYAAALRSAGRLHDAFEAYVELLQRHPAAAPRDRVLQHMFEIARHLAQQRHARWLFGGFTLPERVVPLLEQIISFGPGWEGTPAVLLLLGELHRQMHEFDLAAEKFRRLIEKYPDSPEAEEAAFAQAACLYRLSERYPNDRGLLDSAWSAISYFLDRFPRSDYAPMARSYREALLKRRAQAEFDVARFYDRIGRNPQAALRAYRRFIRKYPHSGWTDAARRRIQELERQLSEN